MKPVKNLRWGIVAVLFCSTTINYIDRQTLSVLSPVIMQELHLNHVDYSRIVSAFQVTYALTWLVGGVFLDVVGTRLGLALAIAWWSVAGMLTSFGRSVNFVVVIYSESRFSISILIPPYQIFNRVFPSI